MLRTRPTSFAPTTWLVLAVLCAACGSKRPAVNTAPGEAAPAASPLEAACDAGTANSCLVAGNDAEAAGDAERAAALYEKACALAATEGCALAGGTYAEIGDAERAAAAFRAGCEAGDGTACYGEGLVALGIYGGNADAAAAAKALAAGCEAGVHAACGELANLYADGNGVAMDRERATTLRTDACNAGDGVSCTRLGLEAWGERKDEKLARQHFERACATDAPDPDGCGWFGWTLWAGIGGTSDEARGIATLDAACDAGSAVGCGMRAAVHARLGDIDAGRAALGRACEIDATACRTLTEQFETAVQMRGR